MQLDITISEAEIKAILIEHINDKLGYYKLEPSDIKIEVKSKQNFKSEWEQADFRATARRTK